MFKYKLPELAKQKGIANAYGLQRALKCSPTMASRLYKGEFEKIGITTLNRLCDLFDCQISDLLYHVKNG